jgi:GH35 family endo-1,4-beta-xylanase
LLAPQPTPREIYIIRSRDLLGYFSTDFGMMVLSTKVLLVCVAGLACVAATPTYESPWVSQSDFCVAPLDSSFTNTNSETLRAAAKPLGIYMGAALNAGHLRNVSDPQYSAVGGAQYSLATAENSCKWGPIHPKVNMYDFSGCDTVHNFSMANDMAFRLHNLCWHNQNPSWLSPNLSAAVLTQHLKDHITAVMGHYKGHVYAVDVVNEAVSDNSKSNGENRMMNHFWRSKSLPNISSLFSYAEDRLRPVATKST